MASRDGMADAEPGQGTERPSRLQRGWQQVRGLFASAGGTSAAAGEVAEQARTLAPVVWLIGKVQSGKTSIIRALTGADGAEIGDGFRACTRTAVVFDYPQEAPVIRFSMSSRGPKACGAPSAIARIRSHWLRAAGRWVTMTTVRSAALSSRSASARASSPEEARIKR